MAWALSRLTSTNRLTRHDGPASVYRAFTPAEMRRLSRDAGVDVTVFRHAFWRMAVVGAPSTNKVGEVSRYAQAWAMRDGQSV